MKLTLIFVLILFSSIFLGKAQNIDPEQNLAAFKLLEKQNSIAFEFIVPDKNIINNELTKIISVDYVKESKSGFTVRAYANQQQFEKFLLKNISYRLIITEKNSKALNMATTVAQMANWDRYPTYSVYEQMMAGFAANYPNLCRIDTIMTATPSGNYRILVAKITDNVNTAENEPQFLYTSTMHGDETTGYYLMMRLINYLLTNYGIIPKVTNLVNNVEIWINPLANPEGTFYNSSPAGSTVANSRRENLSGIDLNRNYPDPRAGQHPDSNSWQPETQAFMAFADKHHFNMAANFHGGAEVMNYPWDTWKTSQNQNADYLWWERVCKAYVDTCRLITPNYMSDVTADGVSEGGDWYVITGGRQDYMNWFHKCREVTIELDGTKTTQTQNLNQKWNENYRSLLNYMQESLYGVRGIITDSCSGQPIRAKVWVNSYDQANDSSHVYSSLPVGNYHKYMIAGTYSITYSAPGYASKTISGVTLANGAATVRNIQLAPASAPDAQFTGSLTNACSGTVQFTNTTASANSYIWYFGDGATSTQVNPVHTYATNGTYTVKLKAFNCKGSDSLVRSNYITVNMISAPNVTNASRCGAGSVTLSATGTGNINWYDAPAGGNLLYTGTNFTTPVISSTTTYYAANNSPTPPVYGGKPDSTGAGAYFTSSTQHGLYFDCLQACTLVSVRVHAGAAGSRTFTLLNSSGQTLQSTTVSLVHGPNIVTLNWPIPVGTSMKIQGPANPNLFRNGTTNGPNLGYPFNIGSMISITQSTAGLPNTLAYYYYFYNWQVQSSGCESSLIPVTATINNVMAEFTHVVNNNNVSFTNASGGATSYVWTFGDGGTSTQTNPSHTYAATGTYTVRLISTNGNCSDTITHTVTITTVGGLNDNVFEGISIFPNPVHDYLGISFGTAIDKPFTIEVFNLSGASVFKNSYSNSCSPVQINLSGMANGIYNMVLRCESNQMNLKIVKIR